MSLPLWDPIALPPDHTMYDINGLPEGLEKWNLQHQAVELWMAETGENPFENPRPWSDEEGMFYVVNDLTGQTVAVALITDAIDDD